MADKFSHKQQTWVEKKQFACGDFSDTKLIQAIVNIVQFAGNSSVSKGQ